MQTIYFDPANNDDLRRDHLYAGELIVISPRKSTLALCEHARRMIEDAFEGRDPRHAQHHMPVERFVEIAAPLKPRFIHHPKTKDLLRDILAEVGCDLQQTYLDVPRLRMVTSNGYLTSGIGYAHHPHRDTWYAAPMAQLNWWLPIYEVESETSMAFHPSYWNKPVRNSSGNFNYYTWNSHGRKDAAKQIKSDTREQPKPLEDIMPDPQVRLVCPPGGVIIFSAAHLHSTVPNKSGLTRFSIDFRTVNMQDVVSNRAAPNIDSAPRGTSLRDFMRGTDLQRCPESIAQRFENGAVPEGMLVFDPTTQDAEPLSVA